MANADMALQAESTTYQGQVHDDKPATADKWASATIDAVLRLHALTLAAGYIPQQPVRPWLDARREVHEALDKTVQAVQFGAVQWANASIGQVTPREDQAAEVHEAAQAVLNAAAAGPLGVELAERLGALNDALGNPPCVYRAGPAPVPLASVALRETAKGVVRAAMNGGLLSAEMAAKLNALNRELGHESPIFPTPYPTNGQDAGWPEGAAADLVRSLGYVWEGGKWQNRKPAPNVLDLPLGVPVVIGRGNTNATRFGAESPVRTLLEHAEGLDGKVRRLEYAVRCARDALSSDGPQQDCINVALDYLRGVA